MTCEFPVLGLRLGQSHTRRSNPPPPLSLSPILTEIHVWRDQFFFCFFLSWIFCACCCSHWFLQTELQPQRNRIPGATRRAFCTWKQKYIYWSIKLLLWSSKPARLLKNTRTSTYIYSVLYVHIYTTTATTTTTINEHLNYSYCIYSTLYKHGTSVPCSVCLLPAV